MRKIFIVTLLSCVIATTAFAETVMLTQAEIKAATAHSSYESASVTSLSGTWSGNMKVNTTTGYIQIAKNANNYYVGSPTFAGAVTQVVITTCADTETARWFYLRGNTNTPQPSSGNYGSGYTIGANGTATIDVTGSPTSFYIYSNGYAAISSITVTYTDPGSATEVENTEIEMQAKKIVRDGQILILRGEHTYTIQGQKTK